MRYIAGNNDLYINNTSNKIESAANKLELS